MEYIPIHTNTCNTCNTAGYKTVVFEALQYKPMHTNTSKIHAKIHNNTYKYGALNNHGFSIRHVNIELVFACIKFVLVRIQDLNT